MFDQKKNERHEQLSQCLPAVIYVYVWFTTVLSWILARQKKYAEHTFVEFMATAFRRVNI